MPLPTNIADSYPDRGPGDLVHQEHHDTVHAAVNEVNEGRLTEAALSATIADQAPRKELPASIQFWPSLGLVPTKLSRGYGFLAFDGDTIIATDNASTGGTYLAKSTDDGKTWTRLGQPDATYAVTDMWVSQAGTWFASVGPAAKICRSTDGGLTWAVVLSLAVIGEGWTQEAGGRIWVAEYGWNVHYSDDDGLTWTHAQYFPNTQAGDPNPVVQHIHGIRALPSGVWVMAGDSNTYAGLWKWDGSTFVKQTTGIMDPTAQQWRTVGLIERDGWLYWIQDGADGGSIPGIRKANPADLDGTVTLLTSTPAGGWYTAAMADGTLLFGGIVEQTGSNNEKDTALRLYAVDGADRVHELFSSERTLGVGGDFTKVGNLRVRASDQTIAFRAGPVDWATAGSVYGKLRPGAGRFDITRKSAPEVYGTTARYWESPVPTTGSPVATTTAAQVPDMAVAIVSEAGAPVRIVATIPLYSAAYEFNNVHLRVDGVQIPNTTYFYGAATGMSVLTIEAIHTPSSAGPKTYSVWWAAASSSSNFQSPSTGRRLRVYQL